MQYVVFPEPGGPMTTCPNFMILFLLQYSDISLRNNRTTSLSQRTLEYQVTEITLEPISSLKILVRILQATARYKATTVHNRNRRMRLDTKKRRGALYGER